MPIIGRISVGDGATFTPDVTDEGVLIWTNNKNLENPDPVDIAQAVVDKKPGWGIPIGYEYFTINPNVPQGSLPLFGGEYDRATYPDLWAWVQTQTGYLKTEAQWQALSSANAGNVPYYSDGDGSTTFRVPSLKCWIKAANGTVSEVGSYLAAGLPNITGTFEIRGLNNLSNVGAVSGVFSKTTATLVDANISNTSSNTHATGVSFNASSSNSIYGNSTTVQPPSIVGMWLVKAYGVVEETGSIDEQQYIDDRMADIKNVYLPANYLPLSGGTMTGAITSSTDTVLRRPTTDGFSMLCGSTAYSTGAHLRLYGRDNATAGGKFYLFAIDANNTKALEGRPDGTLAWNGKEVERVNASGTNYIRYDSGLQICWGVETKSVTLTQVLSTGIYYTNATITFPISFKDANYAVSATSKYSTGHCLASGTLPSSTTGFSVYVYDFFARTGDMNIWWYAIGWWK